MNNQHVKELLIYRHGHAHTEGYASDFDRELRDKGKRNAQRIGIWLARQRLLPDLVLSSPAVRALRTAEKTCKTAGLPAKVVQSVDSLYLAGEKELLLQLRQLPRDANRVLLVGHNPGLEQLVDDLTGKSQPRGANGESLTPASLAWLKPDVSWPQLGAGTARLVKLVFPKHLPRLFPFPGIHDPETRSRPAYYYRQSSVVPYRHGANGLEVLIVSSSKQKHWVIPKGIHDPGLSAQDSAAKEAFEEAGVTGQVANQQLGSYRYPKWDAHCDVAVYPMLVEQVLDEAQWEERHRGRRWVTPQEAASLVKNPDVARLVASLPAWLERSA